MGGLTRRLRWALSLADVTHVEAQRQETPHDCGPTALAMVFEHHGISHSDLRARTGCDPGAGVSMLGLKRAAEAAGLDCRGLQLSMARLRDTPLPMPLVALVHGDHFVTVRSVESRHVIVDDPSLGRLRVAHKLFEACWSGGGQGVVLAMAPR